MERIGEQLPLPVSLPVDETFDSFVMAANQQLVTTLRQLCDSAPQWHHQPELTTLAAQRLPLLSIVGASGRGKSHLLYGVCHRLAERGISHLYLNLSQTGELRPGVFEGLETLTLVALDNLHAIAGNAQWEEALFHLINRIIDQPGAVLICTSQLGAASPQYHLPDLRSRLQWGTTFQLQSLSDEQRIQALGLRARQKGLRFSDSALQFLLHHYDRSLKNLMLLLERLDTRSLQEQKKITVALVKRELGLD
ncbi:DnaA regulatory inactivator Hda [Salinimonas marina]|uniref:DnaA regulatory inactivator Hda n=1 Tax=Salinimonas marina TaxID=2785918 RepID=UPI001E4B559E|nr:DnaA regulatory inactivator Hda [Salinimonas marina]